MANKAITLLGSVLVALVPGFENWVVGAEKLQPKTEEQWDNALDLPPGGTQEIIYGLTGATVNGLTGKLAASTATKAIAAAPAVEAPKPAAIVAPALTPTPVAVPPEATEDDSPPIVEAGPAVPQGGFQPS